MLTSLTIRNLVIVRELELAFGPGMSALTGETGAGKSIMIDALGLTLGDKADAGMIRKGCDRAEVSSEFALADCPAALDWLQAHDLDDGDQLLLRRVLVREGRSRAYINGSPSPQTALRELGGLLLDIHGQHAHQTLLRHNAQRQLLDAYAGLQAQAARTAQHHQALSETRRRREQLQQAASDRANRLDYLEYQLDELTPLLEAAGNLERLDAEQHRLAHAERLRSESAALVESLSGGERDIRSALSGAAQGLGELVRLDSNLDEIRELLESAAIQVDEAADALRRYAEGIDMDPQRLQQIDEQLGRLHDIARKHRCSIEQLPELQQQLQQELDQLRDADQQLEGLDAELACCQADFEQSANKLSAARSKAAKRLSGVVTDSMQTLGMSGGVFSVACEPDSPSRHGIDKVQFRVAANPGQAQAGLAEVASGGELSRISLAIQVATADCGQVPTLIFDEVDVGIGGAVAEIVGQLLRRLGRDRQLLCVTHLAQVAAQAHAHYRVSKISDGKATETRIESLDTTGRVNEVARMLGGIDITEQTLKHADEMIGRAQQTA